MGSQFGDLKPGLEYSIERVIDSSMLTEHVGGAGLFATPSMILLMEQTAHGAVEPQLGGGYTTVGYEVCVRHVAPAKEGETVIVTARLKEMNGHRLLFDVECAKDDVLVGSGTHKRAIIPALG